MKEHAKLSYELLKSTDLSEETLNLIKNHHDPESIEEQILSMADIYSALREKRSYKAEMEQGTGVGNNFKRNGSGKFHACVYKALVNYADAQEALSKDYGKRKFFAKMSFWPSL